MNFCLSKIVYWWIFPSLASLLCNGNGNDADKGNGDGDICWMKKIGRFQWGWVNSPLLTHLKGCNGPTADSDWPFIGIGIGKIGRAVLISTILTIFFVYQFSRNSFESSFSRPDCCLTQAKKVIWFSLSQNYSHSF